MTDKLIDLLNRSYTAYHAVSAAEELLISAGFKRLDETAPWRVLPGGKYYVIRDGSALIAFKISKEPFKYGFQIIASHTDSPCFKIKLNGENSSAGYKRLSVEKYGGGLLYSWLDVPLCIAGRAVTAEGGKVRSHLVSLNEKFVIPSVAIHLNRTANDGIKLNPQVDMQVLAALGDGEKLMEKIAEKIHGTPIDFDLFVTAAAEPFKCGFDGEFICSPRVDNLTSAFASVEALISCEEKAIPVIYLADNEEVGSRTKQGAGSTFLKDVLGRINSSLGNSDEDLKVALGKSFLVSCDNAHAVHPNHPELSDPDNKITLGQGIVIKHHANQSYTTDAMSSAVFKYILDRAGVKHVDFFNRSDMQSGGTLGAISSTQLSVRSADIGIAQLAMHSYCETFAAADYAELIKGLKTFLGTALSSEGHSCVNVE